MDEDLENLLEKLRETVEKDKKYVQGSLEVHSEPVFNSGWKRPYDHTEITIVFGYVEEKLL